MTRLEHKIAIGPPIDVVFDLITEPLDHPAPLSRVLGSEFVETMDPSADRSR